MSEKDTRELTVREKQELNPTAEQTKPGPVYTPSVDIFENDGELVLLADLPGVGPGDLAVDLRDNILTLTGEVEAPEAAGGEALLLEYGVGKYYRQFTLSEKIDQERIDARLTDGVLRLTLPKVGRAVPRRIEINAG